VPTWFVAVGGVSWMFASTNVFTASPEFGATPFVSTGIVRPLIVTVDDACPVTVPPVADVNVT
jgi:hypothetical protein